jgi:F-type H+-transporting ATPase subunit b
MIIIDSGIIFIIINLLVLFLFLKKFLFKPVMDVIEKRENTIAATLQDADNKKAEAYKLKNDYDEELKHADEHASAIIKEAKERANMEYTKKLQLAQEDATQVIVEANKQIELEKKKSMESAQAEIAGIAMLAASKILSKSVDESVNSQLLGDFLEEVGATK